MSGSYGWPAPECNFARSYSGNQEQPNSMRMFRVTWATQDREWGRGPSAHPPAQRFRDDPQ